MAKSRSPGFRRIGLNLRDMAHFPAWPGRTLAVEVHRGAGNGQPLLVIVDFVADQVGHYHRAVPDRLAEPDYPRDAMSREVRRNGEIKWRGKLIGVSTALAGETVCVEETEQGEWRVRFYAVPLGIIDAKTNRLRRWRVPKDAPAA